MINRFRALDGNMLVTGAPECPTDAANFKMQGMIQKAAFDALFIQFYNNPRCNAASKDGFNLDEWVKVVANSDKSQNAKLFVGLAASTAAGHGYIGPKEVKDLICKYKGTKNWGGISLWDLNNAAANVIDGIGFHQHVQDALRHGCDPVASSISATSASTSAQPPTLSTATTSTSAATGGSVTGKTQESTSLRWSNATMTSAPSAPMTTSTVYTTVLRTLTHCPPEVVNCPDTGHVVTETIPLYTTVCPVAPTQPTATQTSVALTTSTVYTTKIHTITSCAPGVVDCHQGKVTTETVSLYTTVCPVAPTAYPEKPVSTKLSVPAKMPTETARPRITSTFYATKVHTMTACPPDVTNCPNGKVVTQVMSWVSTASSETPAFPAASTPERLLKPSPVKPEPVHVDTECSGPGCPAGPRVPKVPGNGCPGVNCTYVSTGRLAPSAFRPTAALVRPSAAPAEPVAAGASSLIISLTGLVAVVAAQLLAL